MNTVIEYPMTKREKVNLVNKLRKSKRNFKESSDFQEFLIDCYLFLGPSAYGSRIEKRWIKEMGYKKMSTYNRGDYMDGDEYVEFKASYESFDRYTFLHIRPHEDVDRYDLFTVDKKFKHNVYSIPKEKIGDFIHNKKLLGGVCNGTSEANENNQTVEYRFTIKKNQLELLEPYLTTGKKVKKTYEKFWI